MAADDAYKPTYRVRELTADVEFEQLACRSRIVEEKVDNKQRKSTSEQVSRREIRCWTCGRAGHVQRYCRQSADEDQLHYANQEN